MVKGGSPTFRCDGRSRRKIWSAITRAHRDPCKWVSCEGLNGNNKHDNTSLQHFIDRSLHHIVAGTGQGRVYDHLVCTRGRFDKDMAAGGVVRCATLENVRDSPLHITTVRPAAVVRWLYLVDGSQRVARPRQILTVKLIVESVQMPFGNRKEKMISHDEGER